MTGFRFPSLGAVRPLRSLADRIFALIVGGEDMAESAAAPSTVADDELVYAIGDVHGSLSLLDDLLDRVAADACAAPGVVRRTLILLGDYIDRGPDSAGVIDRLDRLAMPGFAIRYLLGNHELAMLDFLRDPAAGRGWLRFGGVATLASYGVTDIRDMDDPVALTALRDRLRHNLPARHLAFLENLEPMATVGDYAFVHAGVRPGAPLAEQCLDDLCWIRDPFLSFAGRHDKRIVHGHSISPFPDVRDNRIGVDTGAYAGGPLTALALRGSGIRFLQARGRGAPAADDRP